MKSLYSLLIATLLVGLIGCGSSEPSAVNESPQDSSTDSHDHAHHDHGEPETFAEAVEQIKDMSREITDAFADGKPDDTHGELHDIGHTIESLPDLAKKADLSSDDLASVQTVTEELMDAFEELDNTLHGGDPVDVGELSSKIATQIDQLESML